MATQRKKKIKKYQKGSNVYSSKGQPNIVPNTDGIYVLGHEPLKYPPNTTPDKVALANLESFSLNGYHDLGMFDQPSIAKWISSLPPEERYLFEKDRKGYIAKNFDNFKKSLPSSEKQPDPTFRNEFNRGKGALEKLYGKANYIPVSDNGLEDRLSEIPEGANVMFMDHSGSHLFGVPRQDFYSMLSKKNPKTCIGGSCSLGHFIPDNVQEKIGHGTIINDAFFQSQFPNTNVILDKTKWDGFKPELSGINSIIGVDAKTPQYIYQQGGQMKNKKQQGGFGDIFTQNPNMFGSFTQDLLNDNKGLDFAANMPEFNIGGSDLLGDVKLPAQLGILANQFLGINELSNDGREAAFNNRLSSPDYLRQFTVSPSIGPLNYLQGGGPASPINSRSSVTDQAGYLTSNLNNFTPQKVIQGSGGQTNITTNGMAFPIFANGVPLQPNSGNYIFNGNEVLETPMRQGGEVPKMFLGGLWDGIKSVGKGVADAALTPFGGGNLIESGFDKIPVLSDALGFFGDSTLGAFDGATNLFGFDILKDGAFNTGLGKSVYSNADNLASMAAPAVGGALFGPLGSQGASALQSLGHGITGGPQTSANQGYAGTPGFNPNTGGMGNVMGGLSQLIPLLQMFTKLQGYKEGGSVFRGRQTDLAMPLTKFNQAGNIGLGGLIGAFPEGVPIQTEKFDKIPEQIIFGNAMIANVNAHDSHEDMVKDGNSDMVTDMLPEGAYVTSAYGGIKIRKKKAEDFVVGIKIHPYHENQKGLLPERMTVADVFPKKVDELTPAELSNEIKKKFEVRDRVDIFGNATNEINLESRKPYLQFLIQESEEQKMKKEMASQKRKATNAINKVAKEIGVDKAELKAAFGFRKGGKVVKKDVVKAQNGVYATPYSGLQPLSTNLYSLPSPQFSVPETAPYAHVNGPSQGFSINNLLGQVEQSLPFVGQSLGIVGNTRDFLRAPGVENTINNIQGGLFNQNSQLNQANLLGNIGAIIAQNPDIQFTDRPLGAFDTALGNVRTARQTLPNQVFSRSLRQLGDISGLLDRGVSMNGIQSLYNRAIQTGSDAALSTNLNLLGQENNLLLGKQAGVAGNVAGQDNKANVGTTNRNNQLAGIGTQFGQYTNNQGNLNSALANSQIRAMLAKEQQQSSAIQSGAQNLFNLGNIDALSSILGMFS
jgi:hypothetical protein